MPESPHSSNSSFTSDSTCSDMTAVISEQVLSEVKDELLEWGDSGMSIMEMSHRSKIYDGVAVEAKQDFIDILNVPSSHDVLFLHEEKEHHAMMEHLRYL